MLAISEIPFLVGATGIAAIASVISACAVIFGTNPEVSLKRNWIYKGGLLLATILLAISIGIATCIFFL